MKASTSSSMLRSGGTAAKATDSTADPGALFEIVSRRWDKIGFKSKTLNVNGVDLYVVSGGSGSPIVLLHGYPQSGEIWRFIAPELAKTHQVIIPDLRGMGLSGITNDGYDLPNLAADMHQLIANFGHKKVALAGHDWGGAVGASWALHPSRRYHEVRVYRERRGRRRFREHVGVRPSQSGDDLHSLFACGATSRVPDR